jgi:hypothetical protein
MEQVPNMSTTETAEKESASTVQIGCKLPNGMILEMGKPGDEGYRRVILNGANAALIKTANGYGITEVDAKFWKAWHPKHRWLPALAKGLVFAVGDLASAQAAALERAGEKTGLEPLRPDEAPRDIEVDTDHLAKVRKETATLQSARMN